MMQIDIPLSQLIRLDDAGIPGAKEAYGSRPLNKQHISRLVRSGGNWPPVEAAYLIYQGEERYGVTDGLHRWEAAKKLELEYITANVREYASHEEVIEAMLAANLDHGIPANNSTRKMLAGILYESGMDTEEIANYVGLSERTVKLFLREDEEIHASNNARPTDIQRLISYLRRFFHQRINAPRLYENFDRNVDNMTLAQELFFYVKDLPPHIKQEVIDVCRNLYVVLAEITKER